LIALREIHYSYPSGQRVLKGLNLEVGEGEKVGIVGANGSGKTTLLHTMMGLILPNEGEVELFGALCLAEKDFREARKRMGFVFQNADDQLFCPTVAEDIAFGPRNLGMDSHEAHHLVHEVMDLLEIGHLEARVTHQLSGGEKRLVAIATVLAMKPEILILDEPTTGLDAVTEERVAGILRDLVKTSIVVSHDREFLRRTVIRTVNLSDGVIK